MNRISTYPAPEPKVQYLKSILQKIAVGELRIPAFQREFVWKEEQIIKLLDSLFRGYPIGSLLFWQVSKQELTVQTEPQIPFPNVPISYPLSYVLDGLQRLSVLYGVFNEKQEDEIFKVLFDLRKQYFVHQKDAVSKDACISMSHLFSPLHLLETQSKLAKLDDAKSLIDSSVKLHTAFQEYMIPTVTITERQVKDVVAMFERINSSGTPLDAVDFMRALTWSEQFDLNEEVQKLQKELAKSEFSIKEEILVKVIAVMAGKDPESTSMFELRDTDPAKLHDAAQRTISSLQSSISFLRDEFNISSSDYVPYETQILVLSKYFNTEKRSPSSDKALKRWFITTGFNQELRGKADTYVSALIHAAEELAEGNIEALQLRVKIVDADLLDKRFIRGKALSAAFGCLLASSGARSLISGEPIDPDEVMHEFDGINYPGLLSLSDIQSLLPNAISNKIFANVILSPAAESKYFRKTSARSALSKSKSKLGDQFDDVLKSQFISAEAFDAYEAEDFNQFLRLRAKSLATAIETFCRSS